jgi:Tfp pilus assembly protein PilV
MPPFSEKGDIHLFRGRGFTLGECLIASVLLSVSVLGICGAITSASKQVESLEIEAYCLSLAKELSEEIAARSFDPPAANDSPGWPGNKQRATYDNIADYNGYSQSFDALGGARQIDAIEFSRTVSIEFRAAPDGLPNAAGDFALISVTVTPSGYAEPLKLRRLVARSSIQR